MSTSVGSPGDEDDFAAAATPVVARVGGGLCLLAGILTALTSLQTLTMVIIRGPLAAAPWVLAAVGIATAGAGTQLLRGRAAVPAVVLAGVLALLTGGWFVYSVSNGLISLFAMVDPFLGMLALVASAVSLGPVARVTAARRRLAERGLRLGV